jgi:hypothetical protein
MYSTNSIKMYSKGWKAGVGIRCALDTAQAEQRADEAAVQGLAQRGRQWQRQCDSATRAAE